MPMIDRRAFLGTAAAAGFVTAQSADATEEVSAEELSQLGRTPHTKFAVNIEMWWKKLPFLERIKQAAAFGYPAYEFWPWERQDIDAMAALSQELGIECAQFTAWGFSPGLNDPKNHANFVKKIEEGCAAAKKLNCKKMTVVGGNDQPGMTQKEMHENIITGLKLAAPIAEANDIMLILEAMNIRVDHKGHCLYGSPPSIHICNEVGSPHVKINWDLYHMQITEGDLCGHLREGMKAGQIGYLQLADTPGRNEPGTGEIHYNRVLKEAYDLGYRDFLGLECRPKTTELAAAQGVAAADVW
ncbi:Hydroxypyruvate isomerase [Symmachiella macrocystis]|uniref:Hydroxypyruvate isomerase n=1 Tax=Symmachiella macrocystis TaxID=2527985 RepID=A0A5C6BNW8_9PLAN|nr:TIM barrel protein [Symmachiella macrocystis]TWU13870.1 Hydroxypyruvate isomerase [Symmachiella macrocystis]